MNMMKKIAALFIALTLLLGAALAEEAQPEMAVQADTVLATVAGQEITAGQVDAAAYSLYTEGSVETYPDYDAAIETLIANHVWENYFAAKGYSDFSQEEDTAFTAEAQTMLDGYLDQYVQYYLTEDTDEARAELRAQGEEPDASRGITLDVIAKYLQSEATVKRMDEDVLAGYLPSDEEIGTVIDELEKQYSAAFTDVGTYEMYTYQYGDDFPYTPEGYRAVIHILLEVDQDLLDAYTAAQAAMEEAQSDETVDETAVIEARVKAEEAKAAVLASRQDTIDEIYSRLEKGESFQDLIAEYGTDQGMKQEAKLQSGYKIHADSILYDPAFTAGAFQERMQKPGDVSDPVVGMYGIHILYYLNDVPAGMNVTDEQREAISQNLITLKLQQERSAIYDEWVKQVEIMRNDELIEQFKGEAAAVLAAQQQEQKEAQDTQETQKTEEKAE